MIGRFIGFDELIYLRAATAPRVLRVCPPGIGLTVPKALVGPGTRRARLGTHGKRAARRAKGLEGAAVDRDRSVVAALEPTDRRETEIWVDGPGALLVAKVHKIAERVGAVDRVRDKDALDVLRLPRAVDTDFLADRLSLLGATSVSSRVTAEAIDQLSLLFGSTHSEVSVWLSVRPAPTKRQQRSPARLLPLFGAFSIHFIELGVHGTLEKSTGIGSYEAARKAS